MKSISRGRKFELIAILLLVSATAADAEEVPGLKNFLDPKGAHSLTQAFSAAEGKPHCDLQDAAKPAEWPSFDVDVSCVAICRGSGAPKSYEVRRVFDTRAEGLKRGNGDLLAPLTASLSLFAQRHCLQGAAGSCGGPEQVESVSATKLVSGQWSASLPIDCSLKSSVMSPLDESYVRRLQKPSESKSNDAKPLPELQYALAAEAEVLDGSAKTLPKTLRGCDRPISAKICFGDCIDLNQEPSHQTLGTSEPGVSTEARVCGDRLLDSVRQYQRAHSDRPLSSEELRYFCTEYFWKSYVRHRMAGACAAIRGSVDCADMVRAASSGVAK